MRHRTHIWSRRHSERDEESRAGCEDRRATHGELTSSRRRCASSTGSRRRSDRLGCLVRASEAADAAEEAAEVTDDSSPEAVLVAAVVEESSVLLPPSSEAYSEQSFDKAAQPERMSGGVTRKIETTRREQVTRLTACAVLVFAAEAIAASTHLGNGSVRADAIGRLADGGGSQAFLRVQMLQKRSVFVLAGARNKSDVRPLS